MIVRESNAAYHASAPLSKSRLWEMRRSPQYFKWHEEHRAELPQTDAMVMGSAFHKLVLEPDGYSDEFVVCPTVDRRTKVGKEAWALFQNEAAGKTVLMEWMHDQVSAMAEAVKAHPMARFLTTDGEVETSIYYKDEAELLDAADDTDRVYTEEVLPAKMHYNLKAIKTFSFFGDIKIMFMTVLAVLGKEYKDDRVCTEKTTENIKMEESSLR